MREAERYQLDIVWLTSTHDLGCGTSLRESGWTQSTVALGERQQAGVGICTLGFFPVDEKVCSQRLWVGGTGLEYPAFLQNNVSV